MKYGQIVPFALAATLLTGCGQVMESTANLIDAAAEKIESSNDDNAQAPVVEVVEEPPATEGVVTEAIEEPVVQVVKEEQPEEIVPVESEQVTEQAIDGVVVPKSHSKVTHVVIFQEDGNIRSAPSIDASILTTADHSDKFVYLKENVHTSDGRTWYKVQTNEGVGYVSSVIGYLYYDDWQPLSEFAVYVIAKDGGNVRSEPSIDAPVIATGQRGEEFTFTGDEVNTSDGRLWYGVEVNGKQGYISSKVATTNRIGYVVMNKFYITSEQGNVRSKPDINSKVIYTGYKGDMLIYTGGDTKTSDGRTWYEVEIDDGHGYISGAVGEVGR